ncbi:SGNH/GDSL hydrolase family protein [Streptomyces sp. ME19-01-6]|uniref:SGNH/GDSL hydrolase family protein n=1 Tax=Streptomyces sp. ME19-01-6 TaxID=3028686 RepID=UPI0029B42C17|nr:SGNH/GDSL hydrolase family protein [Streptomyces sp. ME19-01-6]MDX3228096.1 SGNH/GDSL hydrolase family protein [Streptomyces sp. ME19-01-6]
MTVVRGPGAPGPADPAGQEGREVPPDGVVVASRTSVRRAVGERPGGEAAEQGGQDGEPCGLTVGPLPARSPRPPASAAPAVVAECDGVPAAAVRVPDEPSGRPAAQRPRTPGPPVVDRSPHVLRFAALGDSLTEGMGDPAPGGGWRGWAVHLAGGLASRPGAVELVNVSRSGALFTDVVDGQLAAARAARPHLASVVAGANDTLRAAFDIRRVAEALDTVIGTLRAEGAVVLTACLPDPGRMLGLPTPLARPLARRMRAVNTVVHTLSRRYEAVHVHLADHTWVAERAAWSVDRLHPSELGHRLLAREFHAALTVRGLATGHPPAEALDGPPPSLLSGTWWMATRGTRWVADRCTDLLPDLLRLAALECRHALLGTGHRLDARDRRETRAALAAITHERTAHRPHDTDHADHACHADRAARADGADGANGATMAG